MCRTKKTPTINDYSKIIKVHQVRRSTKKIKQALYPVSYTPPHCHKRMFLINRIYTYYTSSIWLFPKIVVPQNGWFIMVPNPIKMDDLGVFPDFLETPNIDLHPMHFGSAKKCQLSRLIQVGQLHLQTLLGLIQLPLWQVTSK